MSLPRNPHASAPAGAVSPLHRESPHESGAGHARGDARYAADLPLPQGGLIGHVVRSSVAHGRLRGVDVSAALAVPGVVAVVGASDVPGHDLLGPIIADEPLFARHEVLCHGHAVALVLAESRVAARKGAAAVTLDIEALPPILDIRAAVAAGSFLTDPHRIARGDCARALDGAAFVVAGVVDVPSQDHFYLESQAALAIPEEAGTFRVYSSTQHPSEVQAEVASVLGVGRHRVTVVVPRIGGGFGGKESQASQVAAMAALGAWKTGRAVSLVLDRDDDMAGTGKRHAFVGEYRAGFDADARLVALSARLYSDGGFSLDLSGPVLDRALFHLDNAYSIEHLAFEGRVCRTHKPSNTAFRGFGGPQGMVVVEDAIARFAESRGLDPAVVRRLNLYGDAPRNLAPYGQEIARNRLPAMWDTLVESSDYAARRAAIDEANRRSRWNRRGIAVQPVKFGISFTNSMLNQAGALVHVYSDGTVALHHGGVEMGQGLHTKMRAVCAHELGLPVDAIRVFDTATDKVPNTVATAASSGSDLNGAAIADACRTLRQRLAEVACQELGLPPAEAGTLTFSGGRIGSQGGRDVPFKDVAAACFRRQVSLSLTGFYRTPGIAYDRAAGRGRPFFYFAFGIAVIEVEVSGLTGEHRVRRVDILHDCGDSLSPGIDRGQVEGAFVQGQGWLTCEEVLWDREGRTVTRGPSTYKVPACGDAPDDFRVTLLPGAAQDGVIGGSKAVGEPPLMLAIGVVHALRHAIQSFSAPGDVVALRLPATPEAILRAVETARGKSPPG